MFNQFNNFTSANEEQRKSSEQMKPRVVFSKTFVNTVLWKQYQYNKSQFNLTLYGAKGDWDFRISDLVKNPDGTYI